MFRRSPAPGLPVGVLRQWRVGRGTLGVSFSLPLVSQVLSATSIENVAKTKFTTTTEVPRVPATASRALFTLRLQTDAKGGTSRLPRGHLSSSFLLALTNDVGRFVHVRDPSRCPPPPSPFRDLCVFQPFFVALLSFPRPTPRQLRKR